MWMDECGHSRAQARFPVPRWSSARAWTWASDSPDEQQRCPHGGGTMLTRRSFLKLTGASTLAWYVATPDRLDGTGDGPDPGRHARPERRAEVRDAVADPAGDAPGGDDHHAGRQTSRLLRDLHAAALPADPAGGHAAPRPCGATARSRSRRPAGDCCIHHAPSLTIESTWKRPVRIKWINELVDANGNYLPHLLPVDPTLHWANPPGGTAGRDTRPDVHGSTPGPYTGPVPIVTHLHGAAGVGDESDGYAEAWYLPAAGNIPAGYAHRGHLVQLLRGQGGVEVRRRLGAGVRDLPVPQRPARVDPVVPRPRPGHDPPQRLRRPGRVLPGPWRPRGRQGGPRQPHRRHRRAAQPGPQRKRHVPAQQDLLRDPDRGPGPLLQHQRLAVLPRHAGRSSTASPAPTSPRPTCRRSGTRSSSATWSWSTATPGRSRPSSSAATGCGS